MRIKYRNINRLNESAILSELPEGIKDDILQNRTSLGNNPAVPDIFDVPYLLKAAESEFNGVKKSLSEIGDIDAQDVTINGALSALINKCVKIETPFRSELERICYNYVISLFSIPDDVIDLSFELCDSVDTTRDSILLDPIDGEMSFEDVDDAMSIDSEVMKRRFLDALCMGIALKLSTNISESLSEEISRLDPSLPELYKKITTLNRYLLFTIDELEMTDNDKKQIGTFELKLGSEDVKSHIEAQGMIFPVLLCESIRGILELFISHGLPEKMDMAKMVLGKSDFLKAEPWDMRIGPHLWRMLSKSLTDVDFTDMPYLLKRISSLKADKFNFLMKEVLAGTKKGRSIMASICRKAKNDSEYDKFVDKMDKMQSGKGIITDDYIHPEEL